MLRFLSVAIALLLCLTPISILAETTSSAQMVAPPSLRVMSGDIELPSTVGLTRWGGAEIKRADTLVSLTKQQTELPYVALLSTITLTLDGPAPDSVTIDDYILNPDGTEKYSSNVPIQVEGLTFNDGTGSFVLPENMLAMFSSVSGDYAPGATIRGFKMRCMWGDDECEYAFMFRTDASVRTMFLELEPIDIALVDHVTIMFQDGRSATFQMPAELYKEYTIEQLVGMIDKNLKLGENVNIFLD